MSQQLKGSMARNEDSSGSLLKAISPSNGAKFSPNLFRWLSLKGKRRAVTSKVYRDDRGDMFIGFIENGYFVGSRLIQVLCDGVTPVMAYPGLQHSLKELDWFWDGYIKEGRCVIDPEHSISFLNDDNRWSIKGSKRSCLWCGECTQVLKKWTEVVNRSEWVVA